MKNKITFDNTCLRERAEELLKKSAIKKVNTKLSEADSLKMMHELEVYQIELEMQQEEFQRSKDFDAGKTKLFHELEVHQLELEMQNEELNRTHVQAEEIAKKYTTLYEFAPTGYFTLSMDGEILELNLCGAQMLDRERSRLINSKFGFFVSNSTKPFFQLFLDKIFITNKKETCEITIQTAGHAPIFAHLTGMVSENNEQCFLTVIDISKRKQAEEELLLKNVIFDTSIAASSISDLDGIIIDANNSFYLNWGYKSKYEVIGKSISSYFAYEEEAEIILKTLKLTGQWKGEFTAKRVNDSIFIAYGTASAVRDKYGRIVGFQSSIIDITEKKQAEEAVKASELLLHSTLESASNMMIASIDTNYKLLAFNTFFKDVMNRVYAKEIFVGMNFLESITIKDDRKKSKHYFDLALSGKDQIAVEEYGKINHPIYESRYNPIINNNGQVIGATLFAVDVTDREKTKRIVELTKQSYIDILNTISEAVYVMDTNGIFIEVNKGAEKLYNYSREELIGKTPIDIAAPGLNDLEVIKCQILNVGQTGISTCFEFWAERKNGEIFSKDVIVTKGRFFDNDVLIATARETTERKQAEKALKESEIRFRKLLQDVESFSIQGYAPDGTTQYWNHASEKLYGYTEEEAIGKNLLDLIIPVEMRVGVRAAIEEMAETATPVPAAELMLKRKDGSLVSVFSYHTIVQVPGKPQELFCIDIDLTERKQAEKALKESEENYRFMFANNPQPMWIYDFETLFILEVNQSAINHYGYSKQEFISMTLKDIHPREDFPALLRDMELAKSNINTITQWRHVKKNKEVIFVEVIAHSVKYNGRNARHVLVNDITERKRVEYKLVNTQEELKKFAAHLQNIREEERILLARSIHDELAQILIAVKFDMGLMKQKLSKGLESVCNDEFLQNFNHVFSLVDNTIHTSRRIMSGLRSELLELLGFTETVKIYTREFEERQNIRCNLTLEEETPVFDSQKSVALFRIYQELLTNVARHAEATELKVYFGVRSKVLVLEVIDDGIGFDTTMRAKPDTYGIIGLKERAFLLDGKLNIVSKPGMGTTVRLEIPHEKC